MHTEKSTHGYKDKRIELFQSLSKTKDDKYIAILSDTSMDRDGEIVGVEALQKLAEDTGYVAILMDHQNKIENMIGEWIDKRIEHIEGHDALVATPKFFESNPKAAMIKGMLDEGARCGISIGAMVKNYDTRKINGVATKVFTELELLEASFVAIPSNRHGQALALAKSFVNKISEEPEMSEETQEPPQEDLTKQLQEEIAALAKRIEELEKREVPAEAEAAEEVVEEVEAEESEEVEASEADKKLEEANGRIAQLTKEVEDLKKSPVFKGYGDTMGTSTEKEVQKGLPIIRY